MQSPVRVGQKYRYSVKDVVRLTGLTTQLLHTWERRYRAVQPQRNCNGARIYSEAQVSHLQLLKRCVDGGNRIGKLAALPASELEQLASLTHRNEPIRLDDLVDATKRMDATYLEERLALHFSALGPVRFCRDVVVPLMRTIGNLWEKEQVSIAGEHLLSGTIRTLLGQALRLTGRQADGPVAVFAALGDDLHELGALCAAVCAQAAGMHALYLGARLPISEIVKASSTLGAALVGLSITCTPTEKLIEQIAEIAGQLPDSVELWIGGAAAENIEPIKAPNAIVVQNISAIEEEIQRFRIRREAAA